MNLVLNDVSITYIRPSLSSLVCIILGIKFRASCVFQSRSGHYLEAQSRDLAQNVSPECITRM